MALSWNFLASSAHTRWRAVKAPHLVALVRAGAVFKNGKQIERSDESGGGDQRKLRSSKGRCPLRTPEAEPRNIARF
jgi:hypothetical protein